MSMRLVIEHPPGYEPERSYLHGVMLGEFLGLDYEAVCAGRRDVKITLAGDPHGKQVVLADVLFQTPGDEWLTAASMPGAGGNGRWDAGDLFPDARLVAASLPVLYRDPSVDDAVSSDCIRLSLDIFGSAFFMLTRYEELVVDERDEHGRFSGSSSIAISGDFLNRPVVNEYLEILWNAMSRLWPALQRRERRHSVSLSHDVDWPLCTAGRPAPRVARTVAGDLLVRKSPGLAVRRGLSHLRSMRGCLDADLCNTFDFIMDQNERRGVNSAFYFITDQTAGEVDGCYSLDDPWIRRLMQRMHERGHEIGLHPSYNSYDDPAQTRHEFERLRKTAAELGIEQHRWGGRQHFLRWQAPTTWQNWEDAGLGYDSTLGFSDMAGFRCGVCYDYPAFNLTTRERLKLREHALIAMEVTLTGYMGQSWDEAAQTIVTLNDTCRRFDGEFTLLWHNNMLVTDVERRTYATVLGALGA